MTVRVLVAALAAALVLTLAPAAHAAPPPLQTSSARAAVGTDLAGHIVVRVKYRDYGYLGVKPVKVCALAQPRYLVKTLRVTFVYDTFRTVGMGEYKWRDKRVCKAIPFMHRNMTKQRSWSAYGKAVVFRIGRVDVFTDTFDVASRMSS